MRTPTIAALAVVLLAPPAQRAAEPQDNRMLLTIFFRHDQAKTLGEIRAHLDKTGFIAAFPPPGIEVVSWYVMMGIGQVVTIRLPPERLREINRMVEEKAWGAYRTDFYPTYDYKGVAEQERSKRQGK